jgi:hypothetical protein
MLNKFQEQDLMASVESLEEALKYIDLESKNAEVIKCIEKAIFNIKNINPTLFNYPRVARYITGKFDSTIVEEELSEGERRGEETRKYIKKLNKLYKEKDNANT